jgi:hypothetical protein
MSSNADFYFNPTGTAFLATSCTQDLVRADFVDGSVIVLSAGRRIDGPRSESPEMSHNLFSLLRARILAGAQEWSREAAEQYRERRRAAMGCDDSADPYGELGLES